MPQNQGQSSRRGDEQDPPQKDVLGRILLIFIGLAALLWLIYFLT